MFLLLASLLVGGGCTDTTSGGVPSTQSDAISPDALSPDSIAPECGKVDSPTYCTAPFSDDTHVANDSDATSEKDTSFTTDTASADDTFGPTEEDTTPTTDPCAGVRVIEGNWYGLDGPEFVIIILTVESDMTCSLELRNDDHKALFSRTFHDVTNIPVEYVGQETGSMYQLDYSSDSILYQRIFTSAGQPNGETRLHR